MEIVYLYTEVYWNQTITGGMCSRYFLVGMCIVYGWNTLGKEDAKM